MEKIKTHRILDPMIDVQEETRTLCGWRITWSPNFGFVRFVRPPGGFVPELNIVPSDQGLTPTCLKCWKATDGFTETS